MEFEKIVNLDGEELAQQKRQAAEQVFRLRFQMRMGQNEGLKKLRELKKDIARIQTVERQRELGNATAPGAADTAGTGAGRKPAKSKSAKTRTRSKSGAKGQTAKKTRKSTRAGGSVKAGSTSRAKAPKRGRANAKKGGS